MRMIAFSVSRQVRIVALAAAMALVGAVVAQAAGRPWTVLFVGLGATALWWWAGARWRPARRAMPWGDVVGEELRGPPAPRMPLSALRDLGPPVRVRTARPVPPAVIAPGERFDTIVLMPPPVDEAPLVTPGTDATIHALLARLERDVGRHAVPAPQSGALADTLDELRRLARRDAA